MRNPILRAAGYRRVSMREQVDGFSLAAQETNIRQHVQNQSWELVELYTDAGISAKKDSQRPALIQLLKDAQAGKFEVVVVDKLDRFYRHLRGLLTAPDQLNDANVSFVSVQERLDFTSVWGKLTLTVLGTLAEVYIDNLRQETRKGKLQRARDGLWNGNPPFGYCRGICSICKEPNGPGYCPRVGQPDLGDGKHLMLHPIESQVIRQMYNWYASGRESDATIAVRLINLSLDGNGLRPRSRGIPGRVPPGPIQKDLVRNLMTNPFYTGVVTYYGPNSEGKQHDRHPQAIYPGQHPVLIEQEQFEKVQEVRQTLGKSPRFRKGTIARDYLLSGILRCGYCGRTMRGSSDGKNINFYYRDSTRLEKLGECPQCTLKAEKIEAQFLTWLRQTLDNETVLNQLQDQQNGLEQAQIRYNRARDLYLAGQLSKTEFEAEQIRYENLEKHLQENELGAIMPYVTNMRRKLDAWENLTTIERKRLFLLAAETVYVRDSVLFGVEPVSALLPFTGKGFCNSGPDGIRTRDLGLDRAACSTATPRDQLLVVVSVC